jgi:hypothetical protein
MSVEDPYSSLTAMDFSKEMDGVDLGHQKTGRQASIRKAVICWTH